VIMLVIRRILNNVLDDVILSKQLASNLALADLIINYNSVIMDDVLDDGSTPLSEEVFPVTGDSLGITLKDGMAHLPLKSQHRLLNLYLHKSETMVPPGPPLTSSEPYSPSHQNHQHHHTDEDEEDAEEDSTTSAREDRKLKRWLIKFCIITSMVLVAMVVVTMIFLAIKNDKMPGNGEVVSTLLKSVTEVIKVLFNFK